MNLEIVEKYIFSWKIENFETLRIQIDIWIEMMILRWSSWKEYWVKVFRAIAENIIFNTTKEIYTPT